MCRQLLLLVASLLLSQSAVAEEVSVDKPTLMARAEVGQPSRVVTFEEETVQPEELQIVRRVESRWVVFTDAEAAVVIGQPSVP